MHDVRKRIAKKARHAQRDVDARTLEHARRQNLEVGHTVAPRRPFRTHADQREGLSDVVAARAHRRGAPYGKTDRTRIIAMVLQMTLDHLPRRFQPERPRRLRGNRSRIDRIEVAACRQHVGPPSRGRTARPGRNEPAFEPALEVLEFRWAARIETRKHVVAKTLEHARTERKFATRDCPLRERCELHERSRRRRAAIRLDRPVQQRGRQQFEPLSRIAVVAPRRIAHSSDQRRPRPSPGRGPLRAQRIE